MTLDTIAARASARGPGAVALIRVSGPRADEVLGALTPSSTELPPPRRAALIDLHDPRDGSLLDRALVIRFVAPQSYTGEDVVELSCHGGSLVPELVLEACLAAGARLAEPGEFTRRAFLHGKLDLVQAEAVADLIEARSRAMHRASLTQLEEGLSRRIGEVREELLALEAALAHHVDFPEEDDAPVPVEDIAARAGEVVARVERLLRTAPEGELLREGAVVVLAGRPNAGKSSLYNALIGVERAIVTEVPGTTRDALEANVQLGGYPFRLVDTAGLRETGDPVERLGVEVARRALERADVVLLCWDGEAEDTEPEARFLGEDRGVPVVLVETKRDRERQRTEVAEHPSLVARVGVSVRSGEGLDRLRELLPDLVYSGLLQSAPEDPVVTNRRQAEALRRGGDEIEAFREALRDGVPPEMAATHLRAAESALEEVVGVVSTDDVLDVVFRTFCIGK